MALACLILFALHHQQVLLRGDVEFVGLEGGDDKGDAIGVVGLTLDE